MIRKEILCLAVAGIVLASCGDGSFDGSGSTPSSTDGATSTTAPAVTTTPSLETTVPSIPDSNPDNAPETVVDKAIQDLVAKIGVSPADVSVVVAESKTWSDGSLGCPQPGMSYTQALVDGSRVLLEVDGRLYAYHAGSDGEPFLCESDAPDGGYDYVPPPGFNE